MFEYEENILSSKALYNESAPRKLNKPTHNASIMSYSVNDNVNTIPNNIEITKDIYIKQELHFIKETHLNFWTKALDNILEATAIVKSVLIKSIFIFHHPLYSIKTVNY